MFTWLCIGLTVGAHLLFRPRSLRSKFNEYGAKGLEAKFYSAEEGRGEDYEYESKAEEECEEMGSPGNTTEGVFIEARVQFKEQSAEPLSVDQQRGINYLKRREQARRARAKNKAMRSRIEKTKASVAIPTDIREEKENDENTSAHPKSPQTKHSFQILQGEPKKISIQKPATIGALTRNNNNKDD